MSAGAAARDMESLLMHLQELQASNPSAFCGRKEDVLRQIACLPETDPMFPKQMAVRRVVRALRAAVRRHLDGIDTPELLTDPESCTDVFKSLLEAVRESDEYLSQKGTLSSSADLAATRIEASLREATGNPSLFSDVVPAGAQHHTQGGIFPHPDDGNQGGADIFTFDDDQIDWGDVGAYDAVSRHNDLKGISERAGGVRRCDALIQKHCEANRIVDEESHDPMGFPEPDPALIAPEEERLALLESLGQMAADCTDVQFWPTIRENLVSTVASPESSEAVGREGLRTLAAFLGVCEAWQVAQIATSLCRRLADAYRGASGSHHHEAAAAAAVQPSPAAPPGPPAALPDDAAPEQPPPPPPASAARIDGGCGGGGRPLPAHTHPLPPSVLLPALRILRRCLTMVEQCWMYIDLLPKLLASLEDLLAFPAALLVFSAIDPTAAWYEMFMKSAGPRRMLARSPVLLRVSLGIVESAEVVSGIAADGETSDDGTAGRLWGMLEPAAGFPWPGTPHSDVGPQQEGVAEAGGELPPSPSPPPPPPSPSAYYLLLHALHVVGHALRYPEHSGLFEAAAVPQGGGTAGQTPPGPTPRHAAAVPSPHPPAPPAEGGGVEGHRPLSSGSGGSSSSSASSPPSSPPPPSVVPEEVLHTPASAASCILRHTADAVARTASAVPGSAEFLGVPTQLISLSHAGVLACLLRKPDTAAATSTPTHPDRADHQAAALLQDATQGLRDVAALSETLRAARGASALPGSPGGPPLAYSVSLTHAAVQLLISGMRLLATLAATPRGQHILLLPWGSHPGGALGFVSEDLLPALVEHRAFFPDAVLLEAGDLTSALIASRHHGVSAAGAALIHTRYGIADLLSETLLPGSVSTSTSTPTDSSAASTAAALSIAVAAAAHDAGSSSLEGEKGESQMEEGGGGGLQRHLPVVLALPVEGGGREPRAVKSLGIALLDVLLGACATACGMRAVRRVVVSTSNTSPSSRSEEGRSAVLSALLRRTIAKACLGNSASSTSAASLLTTLGSDLSGRLIREADAAVSTALRGVGVDTSGADVLSHTRRFWEGVPGPRCDAGVEAAGTLCMNHWLFCRRVLLTPAAWQGSDGVLNSTLEGALSASLSDYEGQLAKLSLVAAASLMTLDASLVMIQRHDAVNRLLSEQQQDLTVHPISLLRHIALCSLGNIGGPSERDIHCFEATIHPFLFFEGTWDPHPEPPSTLGEVCAPHCGVLYDESDLPPEGFVPGVSGDAVTPPLWQYPNPPASLLLSGAREAIPRFASIVGGLKNSLDQAGGAARQEGMSSAREEWLDSARGFYGQGLRHAAANAARPKPDSTRKLLNGGSAVHMRYFHLLILQYINSVEKTHPGVAPTGGNPPGGGGVCGTPYALAQTAAVVGVNYGISLGLIEGSSAAHVSTLRQHLSEVDWVAVVLYIVAGESLLTVSKHASLRYFSGDGGLALAVAEGVECVVSQESPDILQVLRMGCVPVVSVVHLWSRQIFLNFLDWEDVISLLCLVLLHGPEMLVFVCSAALLYMKGKLFSAAAAPSKPCLATFFAATPVVNESGSPFRVSDSLDLLSDMKDKYSHLVSEILSA